MKEQQRELLLKHFSKQRKLAVKNRSARKRGNCNDRLGDDVERRTKLDEVVTGCSYDPEYTSFSIR